MKTEISLKSVKLFLIKHKGGTLSGQVSAGRPLADLIDSRAKTPDAIPVLLLMNLSSRWGHNVLCISSDSRRTLLD